MAQDSQGLDQASWGLAWAPLGLAQASLGLGWASLGLGWASPGLTWAWGGEGDGDSETRRLGDPEKIALCGIIGQRPLRGRCPKSYVVKNIDMQKWDWT